MKAAIDIDGTLLAWPRVLGPLARDLAAAGWEVVLLTGSLSADPDREDFAKLVHARRCQVAHILDRWPCIVVCVGKTTADVATAKARYLAEQHVDLFVDDSAEYAQAARRLSPGTLTLGVWP